MVISAKSPDKHEIKLRTSPKELKEMLNTGLVGDMGQSANNIVVEENPDLQDFCPWTESNNGTKIH